MVNGLLREAADWTLGRILGYETRPLVSIDFLNDRPSSIVDALSTRVVHSTWYDNEWGYANRTAEIVRLVGNADR